MSEQFSEIIIREMRESDILSVMQIAEICRLANWTKNSYEQELSSANSRSIIAFCNLEIIGFVIARLLMEQLEILNIAVLPGYRRKKIGESLLHQILEIGQLSGASECWLEVREKNELAQNFYLANNFKRTGKRLNYYVNPTDHAILMTLNFF